MGKVKNRRKNRGANRSNPVEIPSVQELLQHEEEGGGLNGSSNGHGGTFIQTILEQLQSHTVEERDSGLNSLASACGNEALLEDLLKNHDVVKVIGPMLTDKNAIIRHSAAGALRNMSSVGSEICDFMVSQGIMTHIVLLLKQHYGADWGRHKVSVKSEAKDNDTNATPNGNAFARIDSITEAFIESVNLLWNICENNDSALKSFNHYGLAETVSIGLNVEKYGIKVAIASAQCLNAVTEDNAVNFPNLSEFESLLAKIMTNELLNGSSLNDWLYLQTLCSGISLNLQKGEILKLQSSQIASILRILSSTLETDNILKLKQFSSDIPIENGDEGMETDQGVVHNVNGDIDIKKLQNLEDSALHINNLLNAQMMALEILSNILFDDEDELSDDEDDRDSDDIECMEDETVEQNGDSTMDTAPAGVISEVFEGVISYQLVDKVLRKATLPPVNVLQILAESAFAKTIPDKLTQLRCRALVCYQNMVSGLKLKDLGGFDKMKTTWDFLGQLIADCENIASKDELADQLEAVTSAMRAIVQKWVESSPAEVNDLTNENFSGFWNIFSNVNIPKIQTNIIKIVGGLGIIIVRKEVKKENNELLYLIGDFLLNCVLSNADRQHVWRIAEALDTIFDVFAEDEHNHILNNLKVIEKLKTFLPHFKKLIRLQRKELGENKAIVDTARLNLSRFIEYKVQNGCV